MDNSVSKICARCGEEFQIPRPDDRVTLCISCADQRVYHKKEHLIIKCGVEKCTNTFKQKNSKHKFCCKKHRRLFYSKVYIDKQSVVALECAFCKKPFVTSKAKRQKYCCVTCYKEAKIRRLRLARKGIPDEV